MRNKFVDKIKIDIAALLNAFCMTALFGSSWITIYSQNMQIPFTLAGNILLVVLFLAIYMLCFTLYGTFKISFSHASELIYNQILSLVISDCILYVIIVLLCRSLQSPIPLLMVFFAQSGVALVWSLLINKWYFSSHPAKKTIIIWDVRTGIGDLIKNYGLEKSYQVVSQLHVSNCLKDIAGNLDGAEAVFLSGIHSKDRNKIVKYCVMNDIDSYIIPRVGDTIMSAAKPTHLFNLPVMKVERYCPSVHYAVLKRIGDVLISGLALILLFPLMLIVAIIIKATDGGTVLYRQRRLTLNGKEFDVLKFRSMRMDAEKDGVARLSTGAADDRITPIGRFIRAVRIDELPQLINILKGEMAIVGPRPERPELAAEYEEQMPEFRLRLQAKAGLTGYAQVYGRYNTTPYDKLLMDLSYIAKSSIVEDFKICLATIKILFMSESTAGIAEGERTAMESGTIFLGKEEQKISA